MRKTPIIIFMLVLVAVIAFVVFTQPTAAPTVPEPTPVTPQPAPTPASKDDLIVLDYPLPGTAITSPLTFTGKARGNWFFEASFPVNLVNWDGLIIAEGIATAQGEWMTSEYVPFKGTLTFTRPDTQVSDRGWFILKKDNPSGNPAWDDALEVEIKYQ